MATLSDVIAQLGDIGVYRYALPFLVTFAVVFGILQKMEIFGEDSKRIDAIIGIVAGFFVANYALTNAGVGIFLSNFFGAFAVVLIFLLGVLLAAGIAGNEEGEWIGDGRLPKAVMWLGGLAVAAVFLAWGGLKMVAPGSIPVQQLFLSTTNLVTLVVVLGGLLLIWFIVSGD